MLKLDQTARERAWRTGYACGRDTARLHAASGTVIPPGGPATDWRNERAAAVRASTGWPSELVGEWLDGFAFGYAAR